MSQSSRLSSSVSAMRVLNTGSDVEEAVADALVLFSISFSLEIFQLRNSHVGKPVPRCGEGHGEKLVDPIWEDQTWAREKAELCHQFLVPVTRSEFEARARSS